MILPYDTMHYGHSIIHKYHMHDTTIWYSPLWAALAIKPSQSDKWVARKVVIISSKVV
jgi:hypothetical protein